jgi:AraC family transcriptional regulator
VFQSRSVTIGAFRCATSHPRFADSGPIENDIFVFPRRSVRIRHEGARPFVADPSLVTLYNRGQRYSRAPLSPEGDDCEWFAVERGLLVETMSAHDPAAADRFEQPFQHAYAPGDACVYLDQRALFEALVAGAALDALRIEETVLGLLDRVLARGYAFWRGARRRPEPARRASELAESARAFLSRRFAEPIGVADVARAAGVSAFHLCRTFRAATGSTLHAYRGRLRLQRALDRIADGEDLTRVALELGYSSHSHFTSAFRSLFGTTPSAARRRLATVRRGAKVLSAARRD